MGETAAVSVPPVSNTDGSVPPFSKPHCSNASDIPSSDSLQPDIRTPQALQPPKESEPEDPPHNPRSGQQRPRPEQLRRGTFFVDPQHLRDIAVRIPLDAVKVEHRTVTVGQLAHELHQHVARNTRHLRRIGFGNVGKRPAFVERPEVEFIPVPEPFERHIHRNTLHPCAQRTGSAVGESVESPVYLQERIVHEVLGGSPVARITETDGQQTGCIAVVQLTPGRI